VCHTGSRTCFVDSPAGSFGFFGSLEEIVSARADADPEDSYTARLLKEGPVGAARKVAEEGVEVTIAAISESDERLADEAADLIYHLVVTLRSRGLSLADVAEVLERRHAGR
jgi:phosphoribosyl-ATP pyrophosphohydrolase/phosphoribosyl-AMP cyclohydrolase